MASHHDVRPLNGIRVIDLTSALAGPFATLMLGGMGAEVIKIEQIDGGDVARGNPPYLGSNGINLWEQADDEFSLSFLNRGRDKKSITLNLKTQQGREILFQLIKKADIIVENFSAGTMDRLGIGFNEVKSVNPKIIYCSVSGFGQDGPYKKLKAMDTIIQAMSGVMGATGFADGPPIRVGVPIADMIAPLYAVIGILAALHHREKTGLGQYIDVGMLDSLVSFVAGEHFDVFARYGLPIRTGNSLARMTPFGVYKAKDGYVAICAHTDSFCSRVFAAMCQPELMQDARFCNRGQRVMNNDVLNGIIEAWTITQPAATLVDELNERYQVPCCLVKRPEETLVDPHVAYRKAAVPLRHPTIHHNEVVLGTGIPIKFSETPCEFTLPAPLLGQHNEEIYHQLLGLSREDLAILKEKGVI